MFAARVIGTVVSTIKEESLKGMKFLLLQVIDPQGKSTGAHVVAVDAVGAGLGEVVLYAAGSSARLTKITDKKPCDAVVMAIVYSWDINGEISYKKGEND